MLLEISILVTLAEAFSRSWRKWSSRSQAQAASASAAVVSDMHPSEQTLCLLIYNVDVERETYGQNNPLLPKTIICGPS